MHLIIYILLMLGPHRLYSVDRLSVVPLIGARLSLSVGRICQHTERRQILLEKLTSKWNGPVWRQLFHPTWRTV